MAFYHGKDGKVRIGGSTLKVTRWFGDFKAQKHDITNSESGGFGEYMGGIVDCDPITIEGFWEVGTAPMTLLVPGAVTASVVLYTGGLSGPNFAGSVFVESQRRGNETRGVTPFTINGCASGAFTTTNM